MVAEVVVVVAAVVEVVAVEVVRVAEEVLSEAEEVRLDEVWDIGDEDIPIDVHHLNLVGMMDMGVMVGNSMVGKEGDTRENIHVRGMVTDILRQANAKVMIRTHPNGPMLVAGRDHRPSGATVHLLHVMAGGTIVTHKQIERDIHLLREDVLLTKAEQIGINKNIPTTTAGKLVRLFTFGNFTLRTSPLSKCSYENC